MLSVDPKIHEFRRRVEAEWSVPATAAMWQKHYIEMRKQLASVTQALVEAADPRPGMTTLDIASGTGEPAIPIAKRVAPQGRVFATDLNQAMLDALRQNAQREGVANIETQQCDAQERLPFTDSTFDLVTSRFGVMFIAELERTFADVRRVLKPGGRAVFLVWGRPIPGSYFGAMIVPYVSRMAEKLDPDGPGPMRFAEEGKLAGWMSRAGFDGVAESRSVLPAPVDLSPEECLASLMEIAAPFRKVVAEMDQTSRTAAEAEALDNLRRAQDGNTLLLTAEVVIVTAQNPAT